MPKIDSYYVSGNSLILFLHQLLLTTLGTYLPGTWVEFHVIGANTNKIT